MPELPEAEFSRRLAERALGRPIARVRAPDGWYLKRGLTPRAASTALRGRRFSAARRKGKLVLLDTDGGAGPVLGLHFGMSGRLLVDEVAAVADLAYASNRELTRWDRFVVELADGGTIRVRDPRRLGGVELDPDEARLGPDARGIGRATLARVLVASNAPLKARLMDQSRLAGVGNLIADETCWRAGIDPARPAASLGAVEIRRLHRHLIATVEDLIVGGGSHTGHLQPARVRGGVCPRDGAPLLRRTVGGRTTFSCPAHQR